MAYTTHDATVPIYKQGLKTLDLLLTRAEAHAATEKTDVCLLLDAKLIQDMFDFKRQIQIATDHAKGGAGRLAGVDVPKFEVNETTVAELRARIAKTLAFINSIDAAKFDGAETRDIKLVYPWATYDFTGARFVHYWTLPNFFFHVTTAYNILRAQGVAIGKADFLGA